ncbi:MAG: TIGR01777 family oxidoreductase [Deltaproteobacteria bacterium]|nr:TIGR01777 family oxidoreductase [Deltaproteobacteria bacterium]
MRVFMTGGTGFVGSMLTKSLVKKGHGVTLLTRKIKKDRPVPNGVFLVEGDPTEPGSWQEKVPGHEILINLAGASIFRRWSEAEKRLIRDSRIQTTTHLVNALKPRKGVKTTLLSTSAVGYYGFHGDEVLNEDAPAGTDFLATVAREWEAAAMSAKEMGVRVVLCRFGIVLGSGGGALGEMVPLFKKGLGSPLGSGDQWFSWIHRMDLARIFLFLLEREDLSGPINCTAPEPVRNKELTKALAKVLEKPTFMPSVPGFVIRMVKGEFGNVLLKGQRVMPEKLLRAGFQFQYPDISSALRDLLHPAP